MTSEFDKAAQGVVGGFGGAAEKTLEDERGTLRNTLYDALLSNPEMAARATKLGRQTGLSPDIVERNLPEIERNTRLDQLDAMPKENPVLAAWLSGASNARLAHDDIDNLGQFSNLFRAPVVPKLSENYGFAQASLDLNAARTRSASAVGQYVERNMPASEIMASRGPKASFSSVTSGLGDVLPNTADRIREGVRLEFADLFEREDMAADAMRKRNQIDFSESVITPEFDSKTGRFVYGGASNMLRVAPSITAAILTRNPAVGLAGMAAQVQPEAYGKYRGRGGTPGEAALGSGIETAIEVGTEMLPMGFLVNKFGKAGAKDFLAGYLGRELPTELVAEISQGAVDTAIANPDKTWGQYFSELPDTIGQTVVSTLMMSGGLTAAHTVAGSFVSKQEKAAYAEEQTKVIEQLNQLAASSKVLQRDAETFQSFIAAATEDGPVDTVYVDGRMLMQSGMAPKLAEISPAVRDQLDRAILTGGDIAIPVAEYAARIAPTDLAPQLLDHLKTEPDGFTRAEAQDYMANQGTELQAEVERILTDRQDADTFRASQEVVKQDILGQLNTAARFTPQVNEAYATLIGSRTAVRAAQLGITPEEFHKKYGVGVRGESVGGQQFDQQGKIITDTPEFSNWFGDSKVVDADGKPMVVYHGGLKWDSADLGAGGRDAMWASVEFTTAVSYADQYGAKDAEIKPLYIKMEKPLDLRDDETLDDVWPDDLVSERDLKYDRSRIEQAIKYAKKNGFDGVIHPDTTSENYSGGTSFVVFDSSQVKAANPTGYETQWDNRGIETRSEGNRGTFDPNDPNILNQPADTGPRGTFSPATNIISLLNNANLSTFLHESAHYFFESDIGLASELVQKESLTEGEQQIVDDVSKLFTWHGIQGDINEQLRQWHTMDFEEQRSHHERTAESFEAYLFSGKAPSLELQPIFQRFASWMVNVYTSLKEFLTIHPEAGKLSDEVRSVFDRMIATREEIAIAEQARSMLPQFSSPETSGLTPEAFAAYQAQGRDATATAIDELQAKGLRDLQWLANAKGKQVARLKRESKAVRAEVELEARREVMSQPVYQAWTFLTGKIGQEDVLPPLERKSSQDMLDPTLDSLFVAIAKLGGIKKDQVLSEWGVDPKDIPESGLFGKPVWRLTDGLTLDGMAEALAGHGYLPLDENGKTELNDLGDRFLEELAGNTQYSHAYQPQDLRPGEQIANPAGLGAGRLDLAGLADIDAPDEVVNALKARKMTSTEGLHPDLAATMVEGFSSGDELVRALAAAQTPKEAITELADRLMLERHGELATQEAIELAADAAIHNDARARFVTTEYNALAKATGQRKMLHAAAKEFAAQIIARLRVRDIRPSQYANAETRAAKAAEKASKAGDIATAAAEKRNQVVNIYATRAAYDAKDEVQAGVRYLKKFDKISKTLDPDYQDQIDVMLERFDLKPVSNKALDKRKSLVKWIESQRDAGMEPDIAPEIENEANRKSYKDMTVEEFRGLIDAVKQIEHLGRLKHKLLTGQDKRAFGVIVAEVAASIIENGGKARPVELETPTGIRPWLEGFAAGHRKMASLIRQMDGLKDGGAFWRVLVRGMNEASTAETVMNEQATMSLAGIYAPLLGMKGGLNGDKQFIQEINDSLTRGGRLSVALNWGNATNRARIMDGDGWSEHQVQAILSRLTRAEWDFVNSMWAYIDSYWPQIEAKEKRVTGRAPEKVKADPFQFTVDGETISLTGGYYPIKYDSNRDDRAESHEASEVAKDMMRGAFTRSTTRRGHTKERVEGVKRPMKKTLDVITQHISEVAHDLAWHEWLIDANRLLNAKPINQAIRDHYGTEVIRTMKDALTGIATADVIPQTKIDTALLYLRANVSRSTMGLSLTTAFLQPFGLAQSMVRIGVPHVLRGMARWAGDASRFESSMTWISEKSDFMRLRSKTFNRELHEIKGRVSKGHSRARTIYDASLFMLMQKMQMVADVPTWIGAYEKARAEGRDDATAIALADQAVLDSQGGGQTKDMAEFQRKHPFLTMFYSYFNTTLNLAAESTSQTDFKNPLAIAGWASDMALLMVIPALAPAMLLALMRGEECEGVECAKKLAQAQAGYLLGTVLGVRELSGTVAGYDYAGPPVGRVITELSRAGTQVAQGEADEAAVMSAVRLTGVALGIPTTQILRSWRGWNAWEEGEAPASSILLGPPQKD